MTGEGDEGDSGTGRRTPEVTRFEAGRPSFAETKNVKTDVRPLRTFVSGTKELS